MRSNDRGKIEVCAVVRDESARTVSSYRQDSSPAAHGTRDKYCSDLKIIVALLAQAFGRCDAMVA